MKSNNNIPDIPVQFGFILMIDVLGVSKYTIEQCKNFIKLQSDFKKDRIQLEYEESEMSGTVKDFKSTLKDSHFTQFGDTIFIYLIIKSDDPRAKLDALCSISMQAQTLMAWGLDNGLLFRGSISIGKFIVYDNIILGDAVFDANEWYNKADWFGIIFTPKSQSFIDSVLTSEKLKSDESLQRSLLYLNTSLILPYNVPLNHRKKNNKDCTFYTILWPLTFVFYLALYQTEITKPGFTLFAVLLGRLDKAPISTESIPKFENSINYFKWCVAHFGESVKKLFKFGDLTDISRESEFWIRQGHKLEGLGESEGAILCYDKALALAPDNLTAGKRREAILGELKNKK